MGVDMKVLIEDGGVYIPFGPNEYLCIGSREIVEGCTRQQLAEMVLVAKAMYEFKQLGSLGVTKH